jgi:hypothetical protein
MKHLIDIPDSICKDYEPTGEFREPSIQDYFITNTGTAVCGAPNWCGPRIILRRKLTITERLTKSLELFSTARNDEEAFALIRGCIAELQEAK